MEIGKVTPLQEQAFTALDRLWQDIMMADIRANSKKLDKKIFDKPKKFRYKCIECSTKCTIKVKGKGLKLPSCEDSFWKLCD